MPGRLTVIEQVAHYSDLTQQPTEFSPPPCSLALKSDEQPYGPRHLTIGEMWQPLEKPWFTAPVGQLIIVNNEGRGLQVNPTAEEREAIKTRVVELGLSVDESCVPVAKVRPGQSIRIDPAGAGLLVIRCRKGQAKITVMMWPE